jgi:hypothetical protein
MSVLQMFAPADFTAILNRLPMATGGDTALAWRAELLHVRDTINSLAERRLVLDRDHRLTKRGVADRLRIEASTSAVPALARVQSSLVSIATQRATMEATIVPKRPDPADLGAALLRDHARTALREAGLGERIKLALSGNEIVSQAVEESLGLFTGLGDDVYAQFLELRRDQAMAAHPREAAAIAVLDAAEPVLRAVHVGGTMILAEWGAVEQTEARKVVDAAGPQATILPPAS